MSTDTKTKRGGWKLDLTDEERKARASRAINLSSHRKAKWKAGGWGSGRPPYGYALEKGDLVIDAEAAAAVRMAYALRRKGHSLQQIADLLALAWTAPAGGRWHKVQIGRILGREYLYRGCIKVGNEMIQGLHEPILGE